MRTISKLTTMVLFTVEASASAQQTYTTEYVVTPTNAMIHVLADKDEKNRKCEAIDVDSTALEFVQRFDGKLIGWSFVKSDKTFGYVTWIAERSGVHTTYIANYILKNCALSETRREQKTFDSANRYTEANNEYNRLILKILER